MAFTDFKQQCTVGLEIIFRPEPPKFEIQSASVHCCTREDA